MRKICLCFLTTILFFTSAKATHIVGGDITVKWLNGNNFEVTLTFYRDCSSGTAAFDPTITLGVFDKITHAMQQQFTMNMISNDTLQLGDSCYTPQNLCVERGIFRTTISIPNNPNGYYISWHRCCRNSLIQNIVTPLQSGFVFYAEIADPALQSSTPVFNFVPDAYMCVNQPNLDNYSATDIDGDQLVYSLITPLDCDPTTGCSTNPIPAPSPGPYGTITWQNPYSFANIMGDPNMSINSSGMLSTNPPALGVFVFTVRVEEYRNNVKIGEIRRDFQYQVLACSGNNPPTFTAPLLTSYSIVAGDSMCFNVRVDDPNPDIIALWAGSEMFTGFNMPDVTWAPDTGTAHAESRFCIFTDCRHIRPNPYTVIFYGKDSSCYGSNTIPLNVSILVTEPQDGDINKIIPNVFSPNGDGQNDFLKVNATVNYCFDVFSIKIYNRWGNQVYESNDFFFNWDGKYKDHPLSEGVYYFILTANFKERTFQKNGFVHIVK